MSDEDLLIGAGEQKAAGSGASTIETPKDFITLSVFGVFEDETCIEQKMSMKVPRHTPQDQIALFVWDQVSRLGGLTTTGVKGEYNFYPVALFQKGLRLKLGVVSGVTL